ncbi:hypothetical protein DNHGIG_01560 [Collibacillus ludicampi]|uniref:SPOR domain-containing protein n=1 Tax=Collibacillus ludicampi TaxID=2771369 RepID=A0AAV4LAU3_9BACL|nr:hypothetical protein [Collibacillus ludicampi]GIM44607.1 hypothetical protein DNHGIG_01560 [Collibacillus ludicampi]
MNKSRMTITFSNPDKQLGENSDAFQQPPKPRFPDEQDGPLHHRHKKHLHDRGWRSNKRKWQRTSYTHETLSLKQFLGFIWKPLLLASVTGVLLGFGVLFLFAGGKAGPTVTTIPSSTKPGGSGQAELPAASLYIYQVGVYNEALAAKKAQEELEAKGIQTVTRGTNPTSLLAGIALNKEQGQTVADRLKGASVNYYGKNMEIPARKGVITGLNDTEASAVASYVKEILPVAEHLLTATLQTPVEQKSLQEAKQNANALASKYQAAYSLLQKANKQAEAKILEDMQKRVMEASMLVDKDVNIWNVDTSLAAFYIDYETLSSSLISPQ